MALLAVSIRAGAHPVGMGRRERSVEPPSRAAPAAKRHRS